MKRMKKNKKKKRMPFAKDRNKNGRMILQKYDKCYLRKPWEVYDADKIGTRSFGGLRISSFLRAYKSLLIFYFPKFLRLKYCLDSGNWSKKYDTIFSFMAPKVQNHQYHKFIFIFSVRWPLFATLLLGRSHSSAPFQDVFSISVALSLGSVLQLSNFTPEGSEARVVGRNTCGNEITKKL